MNYALGTVIAIIVLISMSSASSASGDDLPSSRSATLDAMSSTVSHSSGPPWIANVKVSDDTGTTSQVEVDLAAASPSLLVAGWVDYRTGTKCGFSVSQDGGKTWGKNFLVTSTGGGITGDSTVAADGSGNLYLICQDYGASDLKLAVSTDGGTTFSSWKSVTSSDDKPWIRAAGDGTLYMTYSSSSNQVYRLSTDAGTTWSAPKTLGPGNQGSAIATGSTGLVHIAFNDGTGLSYVRSKDWGATVEPSKRIVASLGQFCFSCTPRSYGIVGGGSDPTGKYVAYTWGTDRGSGNEEVWVVYSNDGGDTWTGPVQVNDDTGTARQFQSWAAVDDAGTVHVLWTDFRNGGQNAAYYSNKTASATTFSPNVEVTDGRGSPPSFMGDYKSIAAIGDTVFAVWCDSRSGNGDIYFSSAKVANGAAGVARIDVTPANATVPADQTLLLAATAYDQSNQKVNATFSWNSSGGAIDQNGLFTPLAAGTVTVTASAGGKSGTALVTVVHGALVSISPSPANPTLKADQTLRFSGEGSDSKGNVWTVSPVTWALSGGSDAGSIDASGLFTPNKVGSYSVTVSDPTSGKNGQTTVTVEPGAVVRVDVSPATATITADELKQFTAAAADVRGNPVAVQFGWSAGSGTVSAAGLYTPGQAGSWKVTASAGAASGEADVIVSPGGLARLELSPVGQTMTADETLQMTVKGFDKKENEIAPLVGVLWSATSGQVDSGGIFTPEAAGQVSVTATVGALSAVVVVKVLPGALASVEIEPAEIVMNKGASATFVARALDAKGNQLESFTVVWSIGGDHVGEIDQTGKLTARDAGDAEVRAEVSAGASPKLTGTARVQVRGGLLDYKGGGQFPYVMLLVGLVAVALIAAALTRRRKKKLAPQPQAWPGPDQWNSSPESGPPPPPAPPSPEPEGWNPNGQNDVSGDQPSPASGRVWAGLQ